MLVPIAREVPSVGVPIVGVGGATLGGSGRTPLVLAVAEWLSRSCRVAVVAHGYGAHRTLVQRVQAHSDPRLVGDESVLLARRLPQCAVWVGPSRAEAIGAASRDVDVLVVDGLLQARPERLALSLLAVDVHTPWGSGACLPGGDLRAFPSRLQKACDLRIDVGGPLATQAHSFSPWGAGWTADPGLDLRASLARYAQAHRVGLFSSMARPERFERLFPGVPWSARVYARDHHPYQALPQLVQTPIDGWVMSEKCFAGLRQTEIQRVRSPIFVIRQTLILADSVTERLRSLWLKCVAFQPKA